MPLIMAVCVVIGIMIGSFFANRFSGNRLNVINSGSNRITRFVLGYWRGVHNPPRYHPRAKRHKEWTCRKSWYAGR